jgi:hypothetical protein
MRHMAHSCVTFWSKTALESGQCDTVMGESDTESRRSRKSLVVQWLMCSTTVHEVAHGDASPGSRKLVLMAEKSPSCCSGPTLVVGPTSQARGTARKFMPVLQRIPENSLAEVAHDDKLCSVPLRRKVRATPASLHAARAISPRSAPCRPARHPPPSRPRSAGTDWHGLMDHPKIGLTGKG